MSHPYSQFFAPKEEGDPYYVINADGEEVSLENYENGLRGFVLLTQEVTPKVLTLVAKFKAPDGRHYTIEVAPSGKVLKATFYDGWNVNPANIRYLAQNLAPKQGGPYEKHVREKNTANSP